MMKRKSKHGWNDRMKRDQGGLITGWSLDGHSMVTGDDSGRWRELT